MKRRISQGQAIRSIFGLSLVTHTLGPAATSTPGADDFDEHAAGLFVGVQPTFENGCVGSRGGQPGDRQLADIVTVGAVDDDLPASGHFRQPFGGFQMIAPDGAGNAFFGVPENAFPAHVDDKQETARFR